MKRPVCQFHPDGTPMLAREPTTTKGVYFCMRCIPPRMLGLEDHVPPPEWETFSTTTDKLSQLKKQVEELKNWRWCPRCDGPLWERGEGKACLTCHSDVEVITVEETIHRLCDKVYHLESRNRR